MMFLFRCPSKFAIESKVQHTEHVERSEHSGDNPDHPHRRAVRERMRQYLVLREKSGKRRYTRNGYRTNKHRSKGDFKLAFQAAHFAHILLIAHGVDHGTGTKEQKRFEECVGQYMEERSGIGPYAQS